MEDHYGRERGYFSGISLALGAKAYFVSFVLFSIAITSTYIILLPSLPLGSVNLQAVRFITPLQLAFATVFGVLFSLVIVLNVYSVRSNLKGTVSLTIGSVLASMVNGLCCTPLFPSLFAIFSTSPAFLFAYSPATQAFFDSNYPYFYLLSTVVLLLAVQRLSKNITCCKVPPR